MTPMQLAGFLGRSQLPVYRQRLEQMLDVVRGIDPARTYVGFSAGKDSAVIAHACHAVHPGIPILMVDPGCPTHWLETERQQWLDYAAGQGWALRLFPWDKWGERRDQQSIEDYQRKIHADMFVDLRTWADERGLVVRVMGLRSEESRARRMLVATKGQVYDYKDGGGGVLPIANWRTEDVWAYIVSNGLPWLGIYDKLGPAARNGLVGRSGEELGRIEFLREAYPDVWRWAQARGLFGQK